jgi:hypothetical protein
MTYCYRSASQGSLSSYGRSIKGGHNAGDYQTKRPPIVRSGTPKFSLERATRRPFLLMEPAPINVTAAAVEQKTNDDDDWKATAER